MKTVIITTLGLAMVLAGVCRLQAAGMDHRVGRGGDVAVAQAVHDDHKGMAAGGMEMKHDATMAMKPDTMLNEAAQPLAHDTMKGMQKMIPSDAELRKTLTRLQYRVTREDGTEPPFNNAYWDNHAEGIYVDIISGVPLFSSTDKYDSGTGWPSFTRPIDPDAIVKKEDRSLFTVRTEVRGRLSEAHLGHVFDDGPSPTGLRYCMNSAALRFIPKADLAKEGYGEYETLFN